jgi:hypothetical protein
MKSIVVEFKGQFCLRNACSALRSPHRCANGLWTFLQSILRGSLAPYRLQIRMKLLTLGLTVPFGTTSRAISSTLRRVALALLSQMPGLATLEAVHEPPVGTHHPLEQRS